MAVAFTAYAVDETAASYMHSYVSPIILGMCILAGLACAFFLVNGGIQYSTSSGRPDRMESAKLIIRNALIGLIIVLAASVLTGVLTHAFHQTPSSTGTNLPALTSVKPDDNNNGLAGTLLKALTGFLSSIMQSAAEPFLKALAYFTSGTPLVSGNSGAFRLWLAMVGMADAMFVLAIALIGFHVMSYATFGLDEAKLKHKLPQIAAIFALINCSVFVIDGIIELSNAMIHALQAGFSHTSVWDVLTAVTKQSNAYDIVALLIMLAFLILSVVLLIYYVGRIVTIYLGAILAPVVLLAWLVPGFRDFSEAAAKTYITTIFVLFVHVVILDLAASLFTGMLDASTAHAADPLMSLIVGLATLIALLKTQGVMTQFSYASIGPRSARRLGGEFLNGISYLASNARISNPISAVESNHYSRNNTRGASVRAVKEAASPVVASPRPRNVTVVHSDTGRHSRGPKANNAPSPSKTVKLKEKV